MSDFDQLDKWIDVNAPNLNKRILHTQVASIAGGGESGEDWTPDLEIGFTIGSYDETKDLNYLTDPTKSISDFRALIEEDPYELLGKRIKVTINDEDSELEHKCVIVGFATNAQMEITSVGMIDDPFANPLVATIPAYAQLSAGDIPMTINCSGDNNGPAIIHFLDASTAYIKHVSIGIGTVTVEI